MIRPGGSVENPPDKSDDSSPLRRHRIGGHKSLEIGVLIIAAALPYLNTLLNGFVYDDNRQVLDNPYLRSFHFLPQMFSTTVWSFVGAQGVSNYFRPMMTIGYLFCYQMFGPISYGFHLANVCLHIGVTILVFVVGKRLFGDKTLALIAACLFALHPIHTESVAWVAAVTDLEVTFFYLLTFWFFLRLPKGEGGRSDRVELAMVVSFALTILSKEQSLTLPLVATVYEHFYREDHGRTTWAQKLGRYAPLWLMDLAYVLFRVRYLGAFAPQIQMSSMTLSQTLLSAIALVGQYAWKLLWPVQLCAYYVFRKSTNIQDPRVLGGILALLVCAVVFAILWKRNRIASFTLVWMFATLAPVLNARLLAGNVFAERYLYLPSVGFAWLVGAAGASLWQGAAGRRAIWRPALVAAASVIVVLYFLRAFTRNRDWRNDFVLYAATLKVSPNATHIRNNLGVLYWGRGDLEHALQEWQMALKLSPHDPIVLTNLGLIYAKEKQYAKAEDYFKRAMRRKPDYTDPHLDLGNLYAEQGRLEEAEMQFRAAAALSPLLPSTRNRLGMLFLEEGRLDGAEMQFRASVKVEPSFEGYDGLGDVLTQKGDLAGAERAFQSAVVLNPFDSHAHFGLAQIAFAENRYRVALREYRRGLETDPRNPEALKAVQELKARGYND